MIVTKEPIKKVDDDRFDLVSNLSRLPHKILQNHHLEGLSQILLHELGHDTCFGLRRAVYLVDNPDFDQMIGVAGFSKNECKHHKSDLWVSPASFHGDMCEACFHNDSKKFTHKSLQRKNFSIQDGAALKDFGAMFDMENPQAFSWNMKHNNYGILLFEKDKHLCLWREDLLSNAAALLSLCGF